MYNLLAVLIWKPWYLLQCSFAYVKCLYIHFAFFVPQCIKNHYLVIAEANRTPLIIATLGKRRPSTRVAYWYTRGITAIAPCPIKRQYFVPWLLLRQHRPREHSIPCHLTASNSQSTTPHVKLRCKKMDLRRFHIISEIFLTNDYCTEWRHQ